jgi:arylsulfatase A-like enzyme
MTRREALGVMAAAPLAGAEARPNIVFIMADDLGYGDLSCYGRTDYKTPNVDRLAAQGMRFTQAYANSAVCSATRAALMTGRYQYRLPVGLEEPIADRDRNVGIPTEHPTLPSLLRGAGYATTLVGKWHLGWLPEYSPLKSGYEHFWGFRSGGIDYYTHKSGAVNTDSDDLWEGDAKIQREGYLTDLLGDRAVAVIEAARKPFLLSLHFNAPHWPWEAPGDEAESKRVHRLASFDAGSMTTFARMVERMDFQVGRVLAALDKTGAAKNTIVVFTSDNGGERFSNTWPFSGMKSELLEGGLRVPAIVRWPGRVARGTTSQQVSITMDWVPTLLAAAAVSGDAAYPSDGLSLLPVLRGQAPVVRRKLFWRFRSKAQAAVRDGDLKWLRLGGNTFLFDLIADPRERANLKDRRPEDYRRLMAEYAAWEAGMLPLDQKTATYEFTPPQLADHYAAAAKP